MSIDRALDNIFEGKLDEMRSNFSAALSTKAVEKLEERKIEIAQNYFGLNDDFSHNIRLFGAQTKNMTMGVG